MYIEVMSVFGSARAEVAEGTKKTFKEFAKELDVVKVQRCHSSRQGIIVDVMTPAHLDPTTPFQRSQFAKTVRFVPPVMICAKLFVPRHR